MNKHIHTYILAGCIAAVLALSACTPTEAPGTDSSVSSASQPPVSAGWVHTENGSYYLNGQGIPVTGWLEIQGVLYYLDPERNGAMATGWADIAGQRYLFTQEGTLHTGWAGENGKVYYLLPDGSMAVGWQTIAGLRYCFDEYGVMLTGWLRDGENSYYLHPDGHAARGHLQIDGVPHHFTSTGAEILLVNPWNSVPEGYDVELVHFADVGDGYIAAGCADALQEMWDACQAAGHRLRFCSGYRTQDTQERYFNSWRNYLMSLGLDYEAATEATKKEVAYPGTSEHQLGLAVDLTDDDYRTLDENQAQTATQQWLMENCWDFGFILRYPEGSTDSTGIIYEPWHYRYVGPELARELRELGLTLEEYLDMLTQQEAAL